MLLMIRCDADGMPIHEDYVYSLKEGDTLIPCSYLGNESYVYFHPSSMVLLTESNGWSPMLEVLDEESK